MAETNPIPKTEKTTKEIPNDEVAKRETLDTSSLSDANKGDPNQPYTIEDFLKVLLALRVTLKTVSTAPSYVPRDFTEQFVLYSNGGTYRLYIYLVGVGWKYTALT